MPSNSCSRSRTGFILPIFILGLLLAGCAHDDARLHGTWRSNRAATVAAAVQQNPGWTNAAPARFERFKEMFGRMTVTYANNKATCNLHGEISSSHYRATAKGSDFVTIQSDSPMHKGRDIQIRFVDDGQSYWIASAFGFEERFDRVDTSASK